MTKSKRDKLRIKCMKRSGLKIAGIRLDVSTTLSLLDELDKKDEAYAKGFEDAKREVFLVIRDCLNTMRSEMAIFLREDPIRKLICDITPKGTK